MKHTVDTISPTKVKLTLEVTEKEFQPELKAVYQELADQMQVPGFRKGKVPSQLIDQRVGREYVLNSAVNAKVDDWYQEAIAAEGLRPVSQPEAEVDFPEGSAVPLITVTVEVIPSFDLPKYSGLKVEVEPVKVTDKAVQEKMDELRDRFGTLVPVDRPAGTGDFVTMDLKAAIDGEEVDNATGLSYEVGSGKMIDGLDEAVDGLSAGEEAIFETTLLGGEHVGETAKVTVTVSAVNTKELPEADDDFAQMASEFDTIKELRKDFKKQVRQEQEYLQGSQAQEALLKQLVELTEFPVPDSVLDAQEEAHFTQGDHADQEGEHDTKEHRAEVRKNAEETLRGDVILDELGQKEDIGVDQSELIEFLVSMSQTRGMNPQEFMQALGQSGQMPQVIQELRRRKALAKVLSEAEVTDTNGKQVDVRAFAQEGAEESPEPATTDEVASEEDKTADKSADSKAADSKAAGKKAKSSGKAKSSKS